MQSYIKRDTVKNDQFDPKCTYICTYPLLFPFDCLIRLNKGKNNQGSKTLNGFPNILLAANKILSSNFIKRAISCSPVSFLEQKCEANFMIVLFAVHFLKGSDPIGFLLFSPLGSPGLDFFIRHMLLAHCLAVLERNKDIEKDKYKDKDKERKISLLDLCY